MNGSRSTPPRAGFPLEDRLDARPDHRRGERTSLEALNRTIEGLEARIEGLIAPKNDPRQADVRQNASRPSDPRQTDARHAEADPRGAATRTGAVGGATSRADAISEILQRQRALSASRLEKATENHRLQTRAPSEPPSVDAAHLRPTSSYVPASRPVPPAVRPAAVQATPDAASRDIADALVSLRQDLKRDIEQGLSREMSSLRSEMHGIAAAASQGDALAQDIRADLQRLSQSIGVLGRQTTSADTDALRAEFDTLRDVIDGLAREESVRRMETRWTGVEDRLNVFDAARDDELVALAYRLDDIKAQLGAMSSGPALYALEDKLVAVAQAIDLIGRHMQPDDRRFQKQFSELDARLDEISRAIVASGRTASAADSPGVTRVESRLADLSRQIDHLALPVDSDLSVRIEALSARVEDLANAEAAARLEERLEQLSVMMERAERASAQPDLTGHLADISRKIDALDTGDVSDTLARRFDDLARRIDGLDRPDAVVPFVDDRFQRLEGQLTGIAQRLDETHAAPYDDGEVLRSLQDQIANLSFLISQPRETAPAMPVEVEGRMSALEDYLASSDEYIIEAARQAAEAVMEAYTRNGLTQSAGPAVADIAAISALADDLKTLEDLSRSSDERTARTFEALHETLVHIADKLERIEERALPSMVRDEAAQPFGRRDTAPHMPKAETPDLLADHPVFEPEEDRNTYETLTRSMRATVAMPPEALDGRGGNGVEAEKAEEAEASVAAQDVRDTKASRPARASLLSGLTRRFSGKRAKAAQRPERQFIEPTPPIDAIDNIAPDAANELLEPGSGTPDVKKILERVRAGQSARSDFAADGDKSDFIAAARRAAQQAAQEVDDANRGPARAGTPTTGFARHRRPVLMAVGAVLLAILSYPLVSAFLKDDQAGAPVAALEMQAPEAVTVPEMPADGAPTFPAAALAAPTLAEPTLGGPTDMAADGAVAPLGQLQPQAETPPPAAADAAGPVAPSSGEPATQVPASGPPASSPQASMAEPVAVPADIAPAALADAARSGDPMAFFEIGAIYTEGRGVPADFAKAATWYQRAADAGVIPAQYRLGSLYEKGTGVPRDPAKARALYQQAAESGNANAMHNLAVMLASGNAAAGGASPDFALAGMWFAKAADLGLRDSQFNLAILYARGNGVAKDLVESCKWFSVAAADGDADAAQKRDQVEQELSPEQLTAAKAKVAAFKPATLDAKANDTAVPDAWLGKGVKTSSVDMKKAVRNIQAILNNNGFDAGTPDGAMGAKTVSAIKSFQSSIGQEPNGRITDALVKELLKRNS
jgi:localization factor PodJL